MLKALSLGNFKSFSEPADIRLSPINLIYGENSSGKSSIIQSLLLMKQSLVRNRIALDEQPLDFKGSSVDLGGYGPAVHEHQLDRQMSFKFILPPVNSVAQLRNNPFARSDLTYEFSFTFDKVARNVRIERVSLYNGDHYLDFAYAAKATGQGLYLKDTDAAESMIALWSVWRQARANIRRDTAYSSEDLVWAQSWLRRTPNDLWGFIPIWNPDELRSGRPGRPVGGRLDSSKRRLIQELVFDSQSWASAIQNLLVQQFSNIHYVGPLRQPPQRVAIEASNADLELGSRGERALRLLSGDRVLLKDLNKALQNLEIPYILEIRELSAGDAAQDLGEISILSLKDSRTGLLVTLGDVGVGISQVIPVLIRLMLHEKSLIVIEQPELHLHPRLQARLADVVVESIQRRKNKVILETHSEHMLLRFQRRMRNGSLPSNSLNVLYVDQVDAVSQVTELRLAGNGDMMDAWPSGFFDDRLEDLLADDGPANVRNGQ